MKVLIGILVSLTYVCAETPYQKRTTKPRTEFVIIPSIQTSQQLRSNEFRQSDIVPHTIYGPPNTLESLDYRKLSQTRPFPSNGQVNTATRSSQQQIPQTSYGTPIIPQQTGNNNGDFANNPSHIPPPRRQYLPVFEAKNFNQDFGQENDLDQGSNTGTNQQLPGVNFDSNPNQNRDLDEDVPVVTGRPASDDVDENTNKKSTTDQYDKDFEATTVNPNVYYYLPPAQAPSTTVKPTFKATTTTQAPIDNEQDEDANGTEDDDSIANRPNVAIANAFAGLYVTPQEQRQPTETSGSRILPAELPKDCNQQYAAGYQLQNLIALQPLAYQHAVAHQQPLAYQQTLANQQQLAYQQPLVQQQSVAYQQPLVYQKLETYPQLPIPNPQYLSTGYSSYNAWRR